MTSRLAGLPTVRAIVEELDDAQVARLALIENVQREDMNAVEAVHGYQSLIDAGESVEEVAALLGKKPAEIRFYCQLTRLAPNLQEAVAKGIIGTRVAWDLARLDDENDRRTVSAKVAHGELTAAQVSSFVSAWIAAKEQTTIFGEPEHPEVVERRRRSVRELGDPVGDCVRAPARDALTCQAPPHHAGPSPSRCTIVLKRAGGGARSRTEGASREARVHPPDHPHPGGLRGCMW